MNQRSRKSVLFLGTGNFCRSRFAECLFNSVAARMGLPWPGSSRGLAPEQPGRKNGPMDVAAIKALEARGIRAAECSRAPAEVTSADLGAADRVVALNQVEHQPLVRERFATQAEKVEYWQVADGPEALAAVEKEVMGLVARLLGGGERPQAPAAAAAATSFPPAVDKLAKPKTLKVGRETAGRRGKGVTTVFDLPLDEAGVRELAALLKQRCGTGGTVKDGRIEIQGDQRERIVAELEKLGYMVKRVGG